MSYNRVHDITDRYFSFSKIGIDKQGCVVQNQSIKNTPVSRPNSVIDVSSEVYTLDESESLYFDTQNEEGSKKQTFKNNHERVLVTQLYCNVSKLAAYTQNFKNKKDFLNRYDENNCRPLYYAIKANNLNSIKYLMNIGCDLKRTTLTGDPAIHIAATFGCNSQIIEYFLSFNDNLYETNQNGWTIFHCACSEGQLHLVKHLILKKYFKINFQDLKSSYSGLHLAAKNSHVKIVEFLLEFVPSAKKQDDIKHEFNYDGLDLNLPNNDGQTAFQVACKHGNNEVVKLMLNRFGSSIIDINYKDYRGYTCLDITWSYLVNYVKPSLLGSKVKMDDVEEKLKLLYTLIQYAAKFSNIRIILFDTSSFRLKYRKQSAGGIAESLILTKLDNYIKCLNALFSCSLSCTFFLNKKSCSHKNTEDRMTDMELKTELSTSLRALMENICAFIDNCTEKDAFIQNLKIIYNLLENF
jgi:ankyrin repeat protein